MSYPPRRNSKNRTKEEAEASDRAAKANKSEPTQDELVAKTAEKLVAMGAVEDDGTAKAGVDIKALVKAIAQELKSDDQGLFRVTGKGNFKQTQTKTPENFDILKEADTASSKMGHQLSKWISIGDFHWHAKCLTCGAMAQARWIKGTTNERGHVRHPKDRDWHYRYGGDAIMKSENECRAPDNRAKQMAFERRTPGGQRLAEVS